MLVCLAAIVGVIVSYAPGTRLYIKGQNGLFTILLVTAGLFLLRGRIGFTHPVGLVRGSVTPAEYWKTGLFGLDIYFIAAGLSVLLLLDFSIWRTAGVRIGTIMGLAILQLVVAAISRKRADVGV